MCYNNSNKGKQGGEHLSYIERIKQLKGEKKITNDKSIINVISSNGLDCKDFIYVKILSL